MISIADVRRGALDAIDRIVNTEPTLDDVLRRSVEVLAGRFELWGIGVRRPGAGDVAAGGPLSESAKSFPIIFSGKEVGTLLVEGATDDDRAFLEQVARMLSSRFRQ